MPLRDDEREEVRAIVVEELKKIVEANKAKKPAPAPPAAAKPTAKGK